MSEEFDRGWNAAIDAAIRKITDAPAFPKKDHGGPIADAERMLILEMCRFGVDGLRRHVGSSPTPK